MNKEKAILVIVVGVIIAYIAVIVVVPWLADITVSVNTTLAGAHNMSQYPGTSEFLLASPWILYPMPAVLGLIAVVIVLKKGG